MHSTCDAAAAMTTTTYYKRFRMEVALDASLPAPQLPQPFRWLPWGDDLIDVHAEVNCRSFRGELDSHVFPCLGDPAGCRRLMREIRGKPGFLPAATWLVAAPEGCVATIQSIVDRGPIGSIQNVGVMPAYRKQGLGRALVLRALHGFRDFGLRRAFLEVTAQNDDAVRLYRNLGFTRVTTLYKAVVG